MIYYRVAVQASSSSTWQWRSTVLTSPQALFEVLRMYGCIPKDRIRVFFSSATEGVNEMLKRENQGLASNSITVDQFLNDKKRINVSEMMRLESELGMQQGRKQAPTPALIGQPLCHTGRCSMEMAQPEAERGPGEDHDTPYLFTPPSSLSQALVWTKLLAKIRRGDLEP